MKDVIGGTVLFGVLMISLVTGCRSKSEIEFAYSDSYKLKEVSDSAFWHEQYEILSERFAKLTKEEVYHPHFEKKGGGWNGHDYKTPKTWRECYEELTEAHYGQRENLLDYLETEQGKLIATMLTDPCSWVFEIKEGEEYLTYHGEGKDIVFNRGEDDWFITSPFQKRMEAPKTIDEHVARLKTAQMVASIKECK